MLFLLAFHTRTRGFDLVLETSPTHYIGKHHRAALPSHYSPLHGRFTVQLASAGRLGLPDEKTTTCGNSAFWEPFAHPATPCPAAEARPSKVPLPGYPNQLASCLLHILSDYCAQLLPLTDGRALPEEAPHLFPTCLAVTAVVLAGWHEYHGYRSLHRWPVEPMRPGR